MTRPGFNTLNRRFKRFRLEENTEAGGTTMAAVTDLNWSQVNTALKLLLGTNTDLITLGSDGNPTSVNVAGITSNNSVIKFMNVLHDACVIAQAAANEGKPAGQKLNTFAPATNGTPKDNFVPTTRTSISRADLRTATSVVGTNV